MTTNSNKIAQDLIALEKSYNERFSVGDPRGYFDGFAEDVSYFDPILKTIIVGRENVVAWIESIYSNPHIVRSEYPNPTVYVGDHEDFAVLAYNLNTFVLDDDGNEVQRRSWNATHGYRLIGGNWVIVHSNWAFAHTVELRTAS
ncbi:YybH family protein [Microbacterium sp. 2MCAF23]|uniref:YybH family protein n=1 Tax=Microbacterium sp. 2MCAF23 TaxID=3232985 RepID=UPI003F9683F5